MFEGMHNKMAIFSPDSHLLLSFLIKMLGLGAIALLIGFPEGHFDDLDGTTYFWTFVCNNTPVGASNAYFNFDIFFSFSRLERFLWFAATVVMFGFGSKIINDMRLQWETEPTQLNTKSRYLTYSNYL